MAETREFLHQLDEQIGDLEAGVRQLTVAVEQHDTDVTGLRAVRKDMIRERVETLLPDLSAATIARVDGEVPGFLTPAQVETLVARARQTYEAQLARLL